MSWAQPELGRIGSRPEKLTRAGDRAGRDSGTCREKTDPLPGVGTEQRLGGPAVRTSGLGHWLCGHSCPFVLSAPSMTSAAVNGAVAKNTTGFCTCPKIYLKLN